MSLRSPIGRVLGLGAAGGTHHWWMQRLSALVIAPLGAWFVFSLLALPQLGYTAVRAWLARPSSTVLLLLLIPALVHHSWLGIAVVVEDYVHARRLKTLTLLLLQLGHALLAVAALYAVLRIAFGPAP